MKFTTALSVLAVAGSALASAVPSTQDDLTRELTAQVYDAARQIDAAHVQKRTESDCIEPLLCCGTLTTPLDPIVDPILLELGINAAAIVGSVGLLCHPYDVKTCDYAPQCCTEVNLLSGVLAVGCSDA